MADVTEEELAAATQVVERYYRQWVRGQAADLIMRVFTEEWTERGGELQDAAAQAADDAMTYTKDQYLVLYVSDNTSNGLDAMRDGGSELGENFPAPWAYYTFEFDVMDIVNNADVLERFREGDDAAEQKAWLVTEHGRLFYRKTVKGLRSEAWFIGVVGENTREEVDFGVLIRVLDIEEDTDEFEWISVSRMIKGSAAVNDKTDRATVAMRAELAMAWDAYEAGGGRPDPRFVEAGEDD